MAAQGSSIVVPTDDELLQAQADLWRNSLSYLKSMALKCAAELGIPTAIYRLGGAASLANLIAALSLPQAKLPFLGRLMRLLASSGVFAMVGCSDEAQSVYSLTPLSYLLVDGIDADSNHMDHAPFLLTVTSPHYIDMAMDLADWFKKEDKTPPFDHKHGASLFEESMELKDPEFHKMSILGLLVHDNFGTNIAVRDYQDIFQGVKSVTYCCYHRDGTTGQALAMAFPHMKVTVLDLPQEICNDTGDGVVSYVGGDMFKSIPPAQMVILKMVLHHWSDEDCVKILANCKKAIPSREEGGKVLVGDIILDPVSGPIMFETQLLMDVCMMLIKGGRQRDLNDWRDIILKAGFSDYKLLKKFGARGGLEIYP